MPCPSSGLAGLPACQAPAGWAGSAASERAACRSQTRAVRAPELMLMGDSSRGSWVRCPSRQCVGQRNLFPYCCSWPLVLQSDGSRGWPDLPFWKDEFHWECKPSVLVIANAAGWQQRLQAPQSNLGCGGTTPQSGQPAMVTSLMQQHCHPHPTLPGCCRLGQLWPVRVILCLPSSTCRQELGCSPSGSWQSSTWHAWHCWSAWLAHCHLWTSCKQRPAYQVGQQASHLGRRVAGCLSSTQHLCAAYCNVST